MGLKGISTKAGYLEWDSMLTLLLKLERDHEYKFMLLIALGCYTSLRIGDLKRLTWKDAYKQENLTLTEGKTKKFRKIKLNPSVIEIISKLHDKMDIVNDENLLFINKTGTKAMNTQYINRKLKKIASKYKLPIALNATSSHAFRKTMARHVWTQNHFSERSLLLVGEALNHSSIAVTKRYLGIREQEISDIYLNL